MIRLHFLLFTIICAFVGLGLGVLSVMTVSAESHRAPQGNTIDCRPNRRSGGVTDTVYLVGTVWREDGQPDGIRAISETKVNTPTITGSCSTNSGGKNDSVTTTPGADLLATGTFSIPINASGAPTDTVYAITVTLPQQGPRYYFTWQNVGEEESVDSDVDPRGTAVFQIPNSAISDPTVQIDIGLTTLAPNGTLNGVVWEEVTIDGLRDDNEMLVADVPLGLTCPTIVPRDSLQTATAANGSYAISLWYTTTVGETCSLSISPPDGYELTTANVPNFEAIDSDFDETTQAVSLTIPSTTAIPAQDAGLKLSVPVAATLTQQQTIPPVFPLAIISLLVMSSSITFALIRKGAPRKEHPS